MQSRVIFVPCSVCASVFLQKQHSSNYDAIYSSIFQGYIYICSGIIEYIREESELGLGEADNFTRKH